jgi:hypothetical protein
MNSAVLKLFAKGAMIAAVESFVGKLESSKPEDVLKKYDILATMAEKYIEKPPDELRNFIRSGQWKQAGARIRQLGNTDPLWMPLSKASDYLEKHGSKPEQHCYTGDAPSICCGACELLGGKHELYRACDDSKSWICVCGKEVNE